MAVKRNEGSKDEDPDAAAVSVLVDVRPILSDGAKRENSSSSERRDRTLQRATSNLCTTCKNNQSLTKPRNLAQPSRPFRLEEVQKYETHNSVCEVSSKGWDSEDLYFGTVLMYTFLSADTQGSPGLPVFHL